MGIKSITTVTIALVLASAGCADADLTSGESPTTSVVEGQAGGESTPTDEPSAPEPEVTAAASTPTTSAATSEPPATEPTQETPQQENIEVVESGFSTYIDYDDSTQASWAVVLENPNNEAWIATSTDVTISLLDESGTVLGSESDSVAVLLPGQRAALAGSTFDDVSGLTEIRVQARTRDWEQAEGPFGRFETSGVNVREDEFSGWTVTGTVESSFEQDFQDLYAVAVLRDDNGEIVGGDWTFLDFVPAGGDTSLQVDILNDIAGVASADVYVALSNLSLFAD